MSNISDFLSEIEKLAYKILLWVLLLPKTLLKIIIDPQWVPGYIKSELGGDSEKSFDNYMSPVVLFLIVTLFPAIMTSFIPTPGITVHEPQPVIEGDLRDMVFTVDGKFISSTSRMFHKVYWEVWQVNQVDENGNPMTVSYGYDNDRSIVYFDENGNKVENPSLTFVYGELDDEIQGVIPFTKSATDSAPKLEDSPIYQTAIQFMDTHTIEDNFYYNFSEGEYQVRILIENHDPNNDNTIETQSDTIYIWVPEDETQQMYYDSTYMVFGEDSTVSGVSAKPGFEDIQGTLESGDTYLLALGLLSLPLLFSFGTKILDESGLGATSMKNSFYMQCYYFSPVTATFWALYFSVLLYTNDLYILAMLMPFLFLLAIVIWFLFAEMNAIKVERGISKGRAWGVLFMLIFILTAVTFLIALISVDLDLLRRYSIMLYPIIGVGIFIAYIRKRRRERKAELAAAAEVPQDIPPAS